MCNFGVGGNMGGGYVGGYNGYGYLHVDGTI